MRKSTEPETESKSDTEEIQRQAAQPRNTFGNQHRSQFQAAFQIFCAAGSPSALRR